MNTFTNKYMLLEAVTFVAQTREGIAEGEGTILSIFYDHVEDMAKYRIKTSEVSENGEPKAYDVVEACINHDEAFKQRFEDVCRLVDKFKNAENAELKARVAEANNTIDAMNAPVLGDKLGVKV